MSIMLRACRSSEWKVLILTKKNEWTIRVRYALQQVENNTTRVVFESNELIVLIYTRKLAGRLY